MKKLAQHIELLLRDNDCVILPGFGGFIAHDVPAYYVSEEGLYYPPSRSISFNAAIKMNDGLLAQSYMKSYQVDYARANYMIDVTIEQLTDTLDETGSVTLPHIGTITQDIHQSLQFIPDTAGVVSPAHFGLGSFIIKELSQLYRTTDISRKSEAIITHTAKTINLHINKEVLHRVMSTAAIFLLLLMIALPTGNYRPTDIASLHLTEIIAAPQIQLPEATSTATTIDGIIKNTDAEQTDATSPIVKVNNSATVTKDENTIATEKNIYTESEIETDTSVVETPTPTTEVPQSIAVEIKPEKTYHIIVASLPNHRGADETLAQYINQGYTEASLVERDDRVRISLVQFINKDEANEYLKTLRQNDKFQNAWLLAVRN
jgi:hypothetical protein